MVIVGSIVVGTVCVTDRRLSGTSSTPYLVYGTVEGIWYLASTHGLSGTYDWEGGGTPRGDGACTNVSEALLPTRIRISETRAIAIAVKLGILNK